MLQGERRHAILEAHVAVGTADARIAERDGKVPFPVGFARVPGDRLCYGQAAICVPGIGEHRRGGRIGFDVAADGAAWRGDIAVLIRFCLGHGIGNPRGQARGGHGLVML